MTVDVLYLYLYMYMYMYIQKVYLPKLTNEEGEVIAEGYYGDKLVHNGQPKAVADDIR